MPVSGPEVLLYEKKGHVAYITLNRPERMNALSVECWNMLDEAWDRVDSDEEVRVAVITAAGDKAFCVGMDLKETSEIAKTGTDILKVVKDPMLQRVRQVKKPTIAAINGMSLAGGFLIALNCDLRIAATHATFSIREVKVGRGSPWAVPLLWMMPLATIYELIYTGEPLTAERLYQLGFLNKVVPLEELMPAATAMAETIGDNAPLSVRAAKQALNATMDLGCSAGFKKALEIYEPAYASEDAKEGPLAFAEKRKPVWKGR